MSFELRSQPSSGVVDGLQLVLKRARIFLTVQSGEVIWHETFKAAYEPEGGHVVLYPIGDNKRTGRRIESKPGSHIALVIVPENFYLVQGLSRGTLVRAWVAAYSKDIGLEPPPRSPQQAGPAAPGPSPALEQTEEVERDPPYSFARARGDNSVRELTSPEQRCLLKIIEEKARQQRLVRNRPRVEDGWVLLHWVERAHPYATTASGTENGHGL